jgi:hypothetical protein
MSLGADTLATDQKTIVYHPSVQKALSELINSLSWIAFGVIAVLSPKSVPEPITQTARKSYKLVALSSLVAALQLFVLIARLCSRRPALVINDDGIALTAKGASKWFIRWHEIELIKVYNDRDEPKLGIVPRDVDAFFAKRGRSARRAIKAGLEQGRAPLNIEDSLLPTSVTELADQIEQRFGVSVRRDPDGRVPAIAAIPTSPADPISEPTPPATTTE